ncbi:MAG: prephenate dehydrogenase [Anaerolineae bacterium]|nr:prephenate dehydrogenase [Anaerolineae bacterium]
MDESGFTTPNGLKETVVCIVGLGLMGGSLALALKERTAGLLAVDKDLSTCWNATEKGVVSQAGDDLALVNKANVVILATPMRVLLRLLDEVAAYLKPGALLLDLGSVKQPIIDKMNRLPESIRAVGGHPMCGKEVSGFAHADAELFRNAPFVLCRSERTTPETLVLVEELVKAVDSRAIEMDAAHHDRIVAAISALPYALSAALALAAGEQAAEDPLTWTLASSGFRDTSRLAGSGPMVMADILLTNAPAVLASISQANETLAALAGLIEQGDPVALHAFLSRAQGYRHEWEEATQIL